MVRSKSNSSKQALVDALDRVMAIDLERIRYKTQQKLGWSTLRAIKAELEYRRYLTLLVLYPNQEIAPPSNDADEIWHTHILDTMAYEIDCERLLGGFLHHVPSYVTPAEKVKTAAARKQSGALFERYFGENEPNTNRQTQEDDSESFWASMAEKHDRAEQAAEAAQGVFLPTRKDKVPETKSESPTRVLPVLNKEVVRGSDGCVHGLVRNTRDQGSSPIRAEKNSRFSRMVKIS